MPVSVTVVITVSVNGSLVAIVTIDVGCGVSFRMHLYNVGLACCYESRENDNLETKQIYFFSPKLCKVGIHIINIPVENSDRVVNIILKYRQHFM